MAVTSLSCGMLQGYSLSKMAKLYSGAKMSTLTTGTGTLTLNAAVSGYLTFALAGVSNGDVVSYGIIDGTALEIGTGTYTSAGTTLSRTVTLSTNSNTAINLSGSGIVFLVPRKEDLLSITETQAVNTIFAGPASGGSAVPTFRALSSNDFGTQTANTIFAGPASGGAVAPTFRAQVSADQPAGCVLQCLQTTYATRANLTTVIPGDDTVPTSTEGTQVLSQAITPGSSSNKILCNVVIGGGYCDQGPAGVALFRGSTCIATAFNDSTISPSISLSYLDSPATTSSTTYSVRVGGATGVTSFYLNGNSSIRLYGGVNVSSLTLSEIKG